METHNGMQINSYIMYHYIKLPLHQSQDLFYPAQPKLPAGLFWKFADIHSFHTEKWPDSIFTALLLPVASSIKEMQYKGFALVTEKAQVFFGWPPTLKANIVLSRKLSLARTIVDAFPFQEPSHFPINSYYLLTVSD